MAAEGDFSLNQAEYPCSRANDFHVRAVARVGPSFQMEKERVRKDLEDVIEIEIGPRLVLLHGGSSAPCADRRPTREDVETLANLAIGRDEAAAWAHFESVRARKYSYATLLASFVAPAAQHLGELWRQDLCDFFDVAVGIGRLQALMDRFDTNDVAPTPDIRRRALLIALPGETHLLGPQMVAKFLEATGWSVSLECGRLAEENARTVAEEWIGVIGLTLSTIARLEQAARTIATVRCASRNPHVSIMVGGAAFNDDPGLVAQVGADAAGFDAPTATVLASHLLMRQAFAG
jgi:MerR family transcriptional regulator, light-induced transcriptional regulator